MKSHASAGRNEHKYSDVPASVVVDAVDAERVVEVGEDVLDVADDARVVAVPFAVETAEEEEEPRDVEVLAVDDGKGRVTDVSHFEHDVKNVKSAALPTNGSVNGAH